MYRIALPLLLLALPFGAGAEVRVPDVPLVDQDGREIRLPAHFGDRVAVVSFAFTTCTTICAPMTAVLGRLQDELGDRLDRDVRLVTISLDPRTDTPERLAAYARKFSRRAGWSFLTGPVKQVRAALEALGGWVPVKEDHTPLVLVGHPASGRWTKVHGISSPKRLREEVEKFLQAEEANFVGTEADRAAAAWFTDTELVDQHGRRHRFWSDLLRGKKVLINFGFSSCTTACSPITANLARVQRLLGDAVGREVRMITISVDPGRDTPARMAAFAKKFGVGAGWYFLTGDPADVERVLRRLGGWTDDPEAHNTGLLIGDTATGHWVKALAMAPPASIVKAVEGIDDVEG